MKEVFLADGSDTNSLYLKIRSMIVENVLRPGEKILQNKLAEEIGVSRTPIVKALHKLVSEGLVDNLPNRGFYVHVLNISELLELLIIRQAFDAIVAADIARNRTESQANELITLWEPFKSIDIKVIDDPAVKQEYAKADRRFHELQYEWCSMGTLKKINDTTQILNRTYMCGLVRSASETYQEHLGISNAIARGDEQEAAKEASLHNENTVTILKQFVNQMSMMGLDPEKVTLNEFQSGNISNTEF